MEPFDELRIPVEIICMIIMQVLLLDAPRILHLKRKSKPTNGIRTIDFHRNADIHQPKITQISPMWREAAKLYYDLIFTGTDADRVVGGLWIRRGIDLVYIDESFYAHGLRSFGPSLFSSITRLAVDATLLNGIKGRNGSVSLMDEVLRYFQNVENLVFMAPTRNNPPKNYFRGLRLVDDDEEEFRKQLAFTNFYHCGSIVTNISKNAVMVARTQDAPSGSPIRVRVSEKDKLRALLAGGSPLHVILFQRDGMRAPVSNSVIGPKTVHNRALSTIAFRMRPVLVSASEVMELVEESKTKVRPSERQARTGRLFPSNVKYQIL